MDILFDNWKVVVVGAGTQGHSIAQVFAVNGFETTLVDQGPAQLEKARYLIANNLETLCSVGEMAEEMAREAQQRITFTDRLAPAASQANLVLEAIFETRPPNGRYLPNLIVFVPRKRSWPVTPQP